VGVSSLMDTWILLSNLAGNGERTRTLQVLKSRGMPHSHQVREFVMGDKGVDLVDVYLSGDRVLTGTARVSQVAQERPVSHRGDRLDEDPATRRRRPNPRGADARSPSARADQENHRRSFR
jgi:circadian clock protein KaiC